MGDIDIDFIKKMWPQGYPIECVKMNEDPDPIPPGATGHVDHVDDAGQIHVAWHNGRKLALVPGVDEYKLAKQSFEERQKHDATANPIFALEVRQYTMHPNAWDDSGFYFEHPHFEIGGIFTLSADEIDLDDKSEEEVEEILDNLVEMTVDELISHEVAFEYWTVDGLYATREEAYQEGVRRGYHYGEFQKSWRTYSFCARGTLIDILKEAEA